MYMRSIMRPNRRGWVVFLEDVGAGKQRQFGPSLAPSVTAMRRTVIVCPQNSKQNGLGMRGRARRIIPCVFISPGAWSPGCTGWERPFQHWPCCSPQAPQRPWRTGTRAPQRSRSQTSASVAPVTTPAATKIIAGAGQARSITVSTHKRGTAAALGAVRVHCA